MSMHIHFRDDVRQTRDWLRHLPKRIFGAIDPRKRRLLEMRYGLRSDRPLTLAQVGRRYRFTRERVRQVADETINRLRYAVAVYKRWRDRQPWAVQIEWLPVSVRAKAALQRLMKEHNCSNLRELATRASLEDMMGFKNCGAITAYELYLRLQELGLPVRASHMALTYLKHRMRRLRSPNAARLNKPLFRAPLSYKHI